MHILVTGATGFVGKELVHHLLTQGHQVTILSRSVLSATSLFDNKVQAYGWGDYSKLPPKEALKNVEGVIHLMGENIGKERWTKERKEILSNSRVLSTRSLVSAINQYGDSVVAYAGASAIGIYPVNGEDELEESSPFGRGFLSNLCQDWELESEKLRPGIRRSLLRIGMVVGKDGGALQKLLPIFKKGLGGPIGTGTQMMSWIHLKDLASLFETVIRDKNYEGLFNAVAPNPVTNMEFIAMLSKLLEKPAILPLPKFVLKLALGEMATLMVDGQKVVPKHLLSKGFSFQYPTMEVALKEVILNS